MAATKNKMRMAEKAFIYLKVIKIIGRVGVRFQFFFTQFMGPRQLFLQVIFELEFHINF